MEKDKYHELKEKWSGLSENSKIRLVNKHLHRFARVMRFLRDGDDEIKLKFNDESGETRVHKYTAAKRDGQHRWPYFDWLSV